MLRMKGGTAGALFKGFPIAVAGKTGTAENAHGRAMVVCCLCSI